MAEPLLHAPLYVPVVEHLPPVYREDHRSFAELDGYLGLLDDLQRAYLRALDDALAWLSPASLGLWPPGLPAHAGAQALAAAQRDVLAELAAWFGFRFPASWRDQPERQARFLLRAARLWRRRGTPGGFCDWFCTYFGIDDPALRPYLVEHFKYRDPDVPEPGTGPDDPDPDAHVVTLLVPHHERFADYLQRREAEDFVAHYAPAHLLVRLCWLGPGQAPPDPPEAGGATAVKAHVRAMRAFLREFVSFTSHGLAVRLYDCPDDGRPIDELGAGHLPSASPDSPDDGGS